MGTLGSVQLPPIHGHQSGGKHTQISLSITNTDVVPSQFSPSLALYLISIIKLVSFFRSYLNFYWRWYTVRVPFSAVLSQRISLMCLDFSTWSPLSQLWRGSQFFVSGYPSIHTLPMQVWWFSEWFMASWVGPMLVCWCHVQPSLEVWRL